MASTKLYPIAPDLGKFDEMSRYYPGVTPEGLQVLVAQSSPRVCAYRFDADGATSEGNFGPRTGADALSWVRELGLTPATIRVQPFSTCAKPGPLLSIADEPGWWDGGELGSEDERSASSSGGGISAGSCLSGICGVLGAQRFRPAVPIVTGSGVQEQTRERQDRNGETCPSPFFHAGGCNGDAHK